MPWLGMRCSTMLWSKVLMPEYDPKDQVLTKQQPLRIVAAWRRRRGCTLATACMQELLIAHTAGCARGIRFAHAG